MQEILLPHFNERKAPISMLVLHCAAHPGEELVSCLDKAELSSHYVLGLNGELIKVIDESNRAWHAGEASWREFKEDLNSCSIGIEISNLTLGQSPYSDAQIEKLIAFCQKLMRKHKILPQNVVAHSDIAPLRKVDPGLAFPWKRLSKEGIGLWYQPKNADKMPENDVAKLLAIIGYDTKDEETVIASAYAFKRRFLPEEVKVDEDVYHLVNNVYPIGDVMQLRGDKFMRTLKAVAYSFQNCE